MTRLVVLRAEQERQHTSRVGMVVFLGSWAMMFGALFFTYAGLRLRAPAWPPPGLPALPLLVPGVATAVLAVSSLVLVAASRALARGQSGRSAAALAVTLALGAAFLWLQWTTWASLWQAGLRTESGPYGSVFYLLTCFHALHVLVGLGLMAWALCKVARRPATESLRSSMRLAAMFWHFVGVVWLLVYLTVYVL